MLPENWWGPTARRQHTKPLEAEFGTRGRWAAASMASHTGGSVWELPPSHVPPATSLGLSSPLTGPTPAVPQAGSGVLEPGGAPGMLLDHRAPRPWAQELQPTAGRKRGESKRAMFLHALPFKGFRPTQNPLHSQRLSPCCQGNGRWFGSHTSAATPGPSWVLPKLSLISRWRGILCYIRESLLLLRKSCLFYY